MTALGILILSMGALLVWAGITNKSVLHDGLAPVFKK